MLLRRPPLRVWLWAAASIALVVVAVLLWNGSDAAATESTTAAPARAVTGTPAASVSQAWSVAATQPVGVLQSGRVIVGTADGIRALDPANGREAWHYTRSNAHLCGLTATNGVAVAVFRTADRCNEAVALDAGTGVRQWTRNLNLRPDMSLVSTDRIVLAISPTGLVSLDPTGDTLRWRYKAPAGCRILGAATGGSGVALLQHCPGAGATALMLLDGFAGTTHWSHDVSAPAGAEIRLLGADQLIGVVVGSEVRFLAGKDGAPLRTVPVEAFAPARQLAVGSSVLLWAGGTLTAFDETTAQPRWHTSSLGIPAAPANGGSVLVVPEASGFVRVDGTTGKTVGRSSVAGLASGGVADRIGGTVLYRLPDRLLAYR